MPKRRNNKRGTVNVARLFKELSLHSADEEDYAERPFILSGKCGWKHKKPIEGCCFNMYINDEDEQFLATVGDDVLNVYRLKVDNCIIDPMFVCQFSANKTIETEMKRTEKILCVTWARDTYKNSYVVVCAGVFGHVYVVDTVDEMLSNKLMGSGSQINDIRTNPANSNIIATASDDKAVRVYHIRNEAPLVVIGGPNCHGGEILSLDWQVYGHYIVSASMDHKIMKFDMTVPDVAEHLQMACNALSNGTRNQFVQRGEQVTQQVAPVSASTVDNDPTIAVIETATNFAKSVTNGCATIYVPSAIGSDVHSNYVDCVRILEDIDVMMSKSCDSDQTIKMWKFGTFPGQKNSCEDAAWEGPETNASVIKTMNVKNGDPFFIKFAIDPLRRWLVCGGEKGVVSLYDLRNLQPEPHHVITAAAATVRQVSFSPCGRYFCTVSDDGLVCRFDRVHKSVDKEKLKLFKD